MKWIKISYQILSKWLVFNKQSFERTFILFYILNIKFVAGASKYHLYKFNHILCFTHTRNGLFRHILTNFDKKLAADGQDLPARLFWSLEFQNQAMISNSKVKVETNSSNMKRILIVAR